MMRIFKTLFVVGSLMVVSLGNMATATASGEIVIDNIPKSELLAYLGGSNDFTLIDARSEAEYEAGHIYGAVHLPATSEVEHIQAVAGGLDEALVVYCKSGLRAVQLKNRLTELGYTDVTVLSPNQMIWADELPIFNCGAEEPAPFVLQTATQDRFK